MGNHPAVQFTGFLETLGCKLMLAENGKAKISLEVSSMLYNPSGTVHGGVYATLIDCSLSMAALSLLPRVQPVRVVQLGVNMLRSTTKGTLYAEAEIVSEGNSSFFGAARIVDGAGQLVVHGTGTVVAPK